MTTTTTGRRRSRCGVLVSGADRYAGDFGKMSRCHRRCRNAQSSDPIGFCEAIP